LDLETAEGKSADSAPQIYEMNLEKAGFHDHAPTMIILQTISVLAILRRLDLV